MYTAIEGVSIDVKRLDAYEGVLTTGELHWAQVTAKRGLDLQSNHARRRRECAEPVCEADKFHLLWKGVWDDFIHGRVFLLPASQHVLVDEPDTWAIPRAGLKPAGDGDAPPPNILWDDEKVTAEAVEDIFVKRQSI